MSPIVPPAFAPSPPPLGVAWPPARPVPRSWRVGDVDDRAVRPAPAPPASSPVVELDGRRPASPAVAEALAGFIVALAEQLETIERTVDRIEQLAERIERAGRLEVVR